jgi:cadmium resistance protein CadD (predicted permease)
MYSFDVTLFTAVMSFVATNIDNLVVLTLFFSQCQRRRPIVVGQYLGFSVIIAISWWDILVVTLYPMNGSSGSG